MNFKRYKTILFDCDGVILNSNQIKTESFRKAFNKYDLKLVEEFILFHKSNGGISRYEKIKFFFKNLAPLNLNKFYDTYENALERFSKICKESLLKAEVAEGLNIFRDFTKQTKWLIVSGGDQIELRDIFFKKGINKYFNGGIFGSPDTKDEIIKRELANGNIVKPALFIGDSKLDYQSAKSNSIDFIFLSGWTELNEHRTFCEGNKIINIKNIKSIIKYFNN